MADDGMLLNFEIGDTPLKSQVKFKGGRWRDRVRAQKSAKRSFDGSPSTQSPSTARKTGGSDGDFDPDRPSKKRRTEHGGGQSYDSRAAARSTGPSQPHPGLKTGQISSRLFSSNPTPLTTFDNAPAEEPEPVNPSNAPLSEEAENFHALGLSKRIAQHLSTKLEMKAPTAIQKNTIPQLVKEDHDAFLQAETGSGKTLAYLLPIVQRILSLSLNEDGTSNGAKIHRNSGLFAIVLAPTRELCKQIATVLEKILRCTPWLVSTTVIGGESKKSEKARLRKGVNILIATPGRLADHLDNTKVLDVGTARWLVLDEGDRMMEMGFEDDIRTIVGQIRKDPIQEKNKDGVLLSSSLPSRRVTVLCSATMKMNVQKLGEISLQDAIHIAVSKAEVESDKINENVFSAPSQLKQSYLITPAKLRLVTLIALLKSSFARKGSVMKAILFISCADSVDFHFDLLKSTKALEPPSPDSPENKASTQTDSTVAKAAYITSPANPTIMLHRLHGSLAQPVRTSTLHSFSTCKDPAVLITTDISSRGLDVPEVEMVIEYDPAFAVADHVHRIGRTARAGRPGKAVLFLLPGCEEGYVSLLGLGTLSPQNSDTLLQKALMTAVELPETASSQASESEQAASNPGKQSWKDRAEGLQLHIEQRLLAAPAVEETPEKPKSSFKSSSFKSSKGQNNRQDKKESALLEAARKGYRSHIRAYATHVKEERVYFDMTQLHLGHVAKSFGLREAPGGIGGGVSRRSHKASTDKGSSSKGAGRGGDDDDDDDPQKNGFSEEAARKMRARMKAVMNSSSEFNIG